MKKIIKQELKPRSKKPHFLGSILILILVLFMGELLFRIIFPLPEVSNFNRMIYTPLKTSPELEKSPRLSNASFYSTSDPDGVEFLHTLNLYGFRDKNWRVEKNTRRVMFIGDSFVEGFMAKDDETIPAGFAREAEKDNAGLEVMNLGVSATKLPHYFRLMRDAIPLFRPDDVVVVLYENDLPPPPYDPQWLANPLGPRYYSSLIPRIIQVIGQVIKGKSIALAWNRPPFQFFSPVPSPANPWTDKESKLINMVEPRIAKAMKEGRFNPFAVNEINNSAGRLNKPIDVRPHLAAMQRFTARHNTRLYVVYMPGRLQVSDYYLQFSKRFSQDRGVTSLRDCLYRAHSLSMARTTNSLSLPFLDLTPLIEAKERIGIHCYWDYDPHMRGEGYLFVGKAIYYWWKVQREK